MKDFDSFVNSLGNMAVTADAASVALERVAEEVMVTSQLVIDRVRRFENIAACESKLAALVLYGALEEEWDRVKRGE